MTVTFSPSVEEYTEAYHLLRQRSGSLRRVLHVAYGLIFLWALILLAWTLFLNPRTFSTNLLVGSTTMVTFGGFAIVGWTQPNIKGLWRQSPQSFGNQAAEITSEEIVFQAGDRKFRIARKKIRRAIETPRVFAIKAWDGRLRHFWMISKSDLSQEVSDEIRVSLGLLLADPRAFPVVAIPDSRNSQSSWPR